MSEALERAEQHIRLAEQTSNANWGAAHALIALAILAKEWSRGRS